MDHILVAFMLLWSSGLQIEEDDTFKEIDDIRLLGGSSRCSGLLQVKSQGVWREVDDRGWDLKLADEVCRQLDCGSAVQASSASPTSSSPWSIPPSCLNSKSRLRKCLTKRSKTFSASLEIICSESVRLVNGTSLCSGRLEVKSNHLWSSVCEDDFNQQDAEVVCRELGCGAPSVLQGTVYRQMRVPVWTKEFQCGGHESALLDCQIDSSGSARDTCSSGKAVELTCSEPDNVRLVGGSTRCAGELEVKQQEEWEKVDDQTSGWNLKTADVVCEQLDCGSAVSTGLRRSDFYGYIWRIRSTCLQSKSAVRECVFTKSGTSNLNLELKCSESVRLVNGTRLCSGRLEVKSNHLWSSVCEDDFNLQDAEVVCRELGCGAPSVLQGALYAGVEGPMRTKEFQCEGHESALLDCGSSGSARDTCSSGKSVELTCSEPDDVRLVGGASRCVGRLQMKHNREWRAVAVDFSNWDLMSAAVVCRQLDCGSALSTERRDDLHNQKAWIIASPCSPSESAVRECAVLSPLTRYYSPILGLEVTCSDILARPNISFSTYTDGDSEAKQQGLQVLMGSNFTISCSILPQYPGGSFQLIFTSSDITQNYTLPAVNHSAHFLFSAADHTHQGNYSCVYHIYVFSHNFSSESQPLHLTVSGNFLENLGPTGKCDTCRFEVVFI
ncbi:scavenger receptor cysteine-rich type 1 protein M130-like [Micropterus salmoides]|uniref:scavenger receptor cysteine-rich type 1 protein M130-like n=1 Tax=Micropterus salmoides TaxID=27706 RepID=UPI0018EBFB4A|nr:scavenger receptor cysteine-rich type 1 protein M130-like [Micropterus salmoides]